MTSNTYKSNKWVMIKINKDILPKPLYIIFSTLINPISGSEVHKLAIVKSATLVDNNYSFIDLDSNIFVCNKDAYGTTPYGLSILNQKIEDTIKSNTSNPEIMPETSNFLEIDYAA